MFKSVTLEVSLKPFKQTDEAYIRKVCRGILEQWRPLLKNRESISLMFWTGDGSEILDYDGDLSKSFEWAYFIGTANLPLRKEEESPAISLHHRTRHYMKNPPVMTYAILKNIIATFKEEGKKMYPNSVIRVGETFDIGPEFAISDFKYNRHKEITNNKKIDRFGFIESVAVLNADDRKYAAYPNGIPQDTPFATFLGAQTKAFFKDMGFDYLWLSNGLGFSADPWDLTGKIFDGEKFYPEKLKDTSDKVFDFWRLFREACPDIRVETRGTNNSVGIDYATDGVALYDIYNGGFNFLPPPNSPWAALDGNYGLELMGHMTRICNVPENEFLFRFYVHDPWWMNSPWYDRYEGFPTDIYLPMALARLDEKGKVQTATHLNILTVDNCLGDLPDACANEPIPHILKAEKDAADEPSFLVWVYPMKEYTTASSECALREMYKGDTYIMEAISNGFPLNSVVSTDNFLKHSNDLYKGRILVAPVIDNDEVAAKLQAFVNGGGKLLLYGTAEVLQGCTLTGETITRLDVEEDAEKARESLRDYGYDIRFERKEGSQKLPVWSMIRSDNGNFFSVYNPDTTTETWFKFPLGAPLLLGGETEIKDGFSKYRFTRCEHRECRVFVQQVDGVLSMREEYPSSGKYRRRIRVDGLKDATVYYFPEAYTKDFVTVTKTAPPWTPEEEEGWTPIVDETFGKGFKAEHQNGNISFLMPFENPI